MTPKQATFVREYLIDKNATQAAIRAGYSARTAEQAGYQLLQKTSVRQAIDEALADVAQRVGITVDMVLRERRRLAFFDPRRLYREDGSPIPIHELDADTAAAIAGLEVLEAYEGSGENRRFVGYTKKYRLAGKDPSLTALEKYFGIQEKVIRFALPTIETPADCAKAQTAILQALAAGALMPTESETLSGLVEMARRGFETAELAERLTAIEELLKARET